MMCPKSILSLGFILLLVACGTDVERSLGSSGGSTNLTQVALPQMNPSFGTFDAPVSVTVTTTTAGAEIYCTRDGSTPTTSSAFYSTPVVIAQTTLLLCRGFRTGMTPSATAEGVFVIEGTEPGSRVAPLQMDPGAGTYPPPLEVEVTTSTSGAEIHCTQDGSEPTQASTLYTQPIEIVQDTTLRCRGYRDGLAPSVIASAAYVIEGEPNPDSYQVVPIEIEFSVDGTETLWVLDGIMDLVHVSLLAAENPQVTIWRPDGSVQRIEEWELSPYHEEDGITCNWGGAPATDCVSSPLDLELPGLVAGEDEFIYALDRIVGRGSVRMGDSGEIVIEDADADRSFYWIAFEYWYRKSDI